MDNFDWDDLELKNDIQDAQGVANVLVRIKSSSYQSNTNQCKIYSAIYNILNNTESAEQLFEDWSK